MATGTAVDVVMPQMGVSVSEGTVTKWLRQVGDRSRADEPLLEISTDKVDTEVPSPGTGVLQEILVQEGETVAVGTLLARIGAGRRRRAAAPAPPPRAAARRRCRADAEPEPPRPSPHPRRRAGAGARAAAPEPAPAPRAGRAAPAPRPGTAPHGDAPHVRLAGRRAHRRRARDRPGDRRRHRPRRPRDEEGHPGLRRGGRRDERPRRDRGARRAGSAAPRRRQRPPAARSAPARRSPRSSPAPATAQPQAAAPAPAGRDVEPMTAMRRGIAEHMRRSLDTAAHVTSAIEVDMSKVVAIREQLKAEYKAAYGVNLTYLAFVARATVETLARLAVRERRDPRRVDRHPQLRQPRLRGRARRAARG